jgi:mono/diheme cytochrome c family protein
LVAYTRALAAPSSALTAPLRVPTPSSEDLAFANPYAPDQLQRGAAVYAAHACDACHGPRGNAPGDLGIGPDRKSMANFQAFRDMLAKPDAAMPINSDHDLNDQEQRDLYAFVGSLPPTKKASRPGA